MPATQKAFQVTKYAQQDWKQHSSVTDIPVPEPAEGEVLVNVYLRPVNPTDIIMLTSGWGGTPLPNVIGSEGVGKVHRNGPGASKFREGQRVVAVQWPQFESRGTWQQYVAVKEKNLFAVPDDVSDDIAAQFFINPVTVVGMIQELGVKKGDWLLQSAASSVLGRQVIQLCKHKGIKTINVVRRDAARKECLDVGGDIAISTESEDVVKRVKEVTKDAGVSGVLDAVAGKLVGTLFQVLEKGAKYLTYGVLSYPEPIELDSMTLLGSGATLGSFIIYGWIEREDKEAILQQTWELLQKKIIQPDLGKHYKLEDAAEAIEASQKSGRGSKLFLEG